MGSWYTPDWHPWKLVNRRETFGAMLEAQQTQIKGEDDYSQSWWICGNYSQEESKICVQHCKQKNITYSEHN